VTALRPCPACARHVRPADDACPFCGAAVPPATPRPQLVGKITRAAVFTALAGCWTNTTPAEQHTTPDPDHTTDHTADPAPATGTIEGIVSDANGPIDGARVSLDGRTGATTNAQGRYHFDRVAAGPHQLMISTQGNRNHGGGRMVQMPIVVDGNKVARGDAQLDVVDPAFDPNNIPKPYGAPPARRRIV
jgi:hypothetical protein